MRKTRKMRIYVGKCDIEAGIPCECDKCGIAQALKRRFPKSKIEVGPVGDVEIGKIQYQTCNIGCKFIAQFDRNKKKCKPCHIVLTKV